MQVVNEDATSGDMEGDRHITATKRGRYHHGDLRVDLLRVAREEIARHGARHVSLSSLARLAGVSQPAPYRHFSDREELLEAVAAEAFEALRHRLADAVVGKEPRAAFEALALAYVGFGEANVEIYRLMFASRLTAEAKDESALDLAARRALDALRNALSASSFAGSDELETSVYRTWAELHGLVMLKADGFIARPLAHFVGSRSKASRGDAPAP